MRELIEECTAGERVYVKTGYGIMRHGSKIVPRGLKDVDGEGEASIHDAMIATKFMWQNIVEDMVLYLAAKSLWHYFP
jgi:hypothetical protein